MLVLVEIGVLMLVVTFLTCLFTSLLVLAYGYLVVILLWSLYLDSLLFCMSLHDDGYNCLNTCLYTL
jgi:hypothetical protein